MEDTFIVFFDKKVLVTLIEFEDHHFQTNEMVLDWYSQVYDFERERLTGCWSHSISVKGMKYKDFQEKK